MALGQKNTTRSRKSLLLALTHAHKHTHRHFISSHKKQKQSVSGRLHVEDLLGGAAAAQPVPAGPPADGRVPQRRQEDLHRHGLPDEPGHGEVQLGEAQRAALPDDVIDQ